MKKQPALYPKIGIKNNSEAVKTVCVQGIFLREQGVFPSEIEEQINAVLCQLPRWVTHPTWIEKLEAEREVLSLILECHENDAIEEIARKQLEKIEKVLNEPREDLHGISRKEYAQGFRVYDKNQEKFLHSHALTQSTRKGEEYNIFTSAFRDQEAAGRMHPMFRKEEEKKEHFPTSLFEEQEREALKYPEEIKGNFTFEEYKKLGYIPRTIKGNLDFSALESAEGIVFPEVVTGNVNLNGLECADGLVLPKEIGGNLYLNNLTSVENLILPEHIGGLLYLEGLGEFERLIFEETYDIKILDVRVGEPEQHVLEKTYNEEIPENEYGLVCKFFGKKK